MSVFAAAGPDVLAKPDLVNVVYDETVMRTSIGIPRANRGRLDSVQYLSSPLFLK